MNTPTGSPGGPALTAAQALTEAVAHMAMATGSLQVGAHRNAAAHFLAAAGYYDRADRPTHAALARRKYLAEQALAGPAGPTNTEGLVG